MTASSSRQHQGLHVARLPHDSRRAKKANRVGARSSLATGAQVREFRLVPGDASAHSQRQRLQARQGKSINKELPTQLSIDAAVSSAREYAFQAAVVVASEMATAHITPARVAERTARLPADRTN